MSRASACSPRAGISLQATCAKSALSQFRSRHRQERERCVVEPVYASSRCDPVGGAVQTMPPHKNFQRLMAADATQTDVARRVMASGWLIVLWHNYSMLQNLIQDEPITRTQMSFETLFQRKLTRLGRKVFKCFLTLNVNMKQKSELRQLWNRLLLGSFQVFFLYQTGV